jgi:hypothetical protein
LFISAKCQWTRVPIFAQSSSNMFVCTGKTIDPNVVSSIKIILKVRKATIVLPNYSYLSHCSDE